MTNESGAAAQGGHWLRRVVVLVVASLYVAACTSPAVANVGGGRAGSTVPGIFTLYAVVTGDPLAIAAISSNLFLMVGWILVVLRRDRAAAKLALIAAILSVISLVVVGIDNLRVGFYLWESSIAGLLLGAIVLGKLWEESE